MSPDKKASETRLTLAVGAASFLLAATLFAVGAGVYGRDMGPTVFGGIAGIFAEAALVVLLLDRINRLQEARDWAIVRESVGQSMAATMVDLMRLGGIRWSPVAHGVNRNRHAEFVRLAEIHLADLRSQLEGLAVRAEPGDYRTARRVVLRLAWLLRILSSAPDRAVPPGPEWPVVVDTVRAIGAYLAIDVSSALAGPLTHEPVAQRHSQTDLVDAFWRERMRIQQRLLDSGTGAAREHGILFDIDGNVAVSYFTIDARLVDRFSGAVTFGTASAG